MDGGTRTDDGSEQSDGQEVADPATRTVRLLSRMCGTCVCHPDDLMHMGERRQRFIDEVRARDSFVVCHDTGDRTDIPAAICRGYYNRHWREISSLRLATAFGFMTEVDPPEVGFVEGKMGAGTAD